ncbi:hypothetical protein DFP72DRAFT_855742 [Ephemerocybe angulata]|uniref:Uncharacterized protein n=1 Tax=Ephemerocybe angulata TaxID=980116 RepID=A0A8H6HFJ4_9AGAR|nr:hypothetical protein DFP72DRAFT_855742 [Tulosesus angulatus]
MSQDLPPGLRTLQEYAGLAKLYWAQKGSCPSPAVTPSRVPLDVQGEIGTIVGVLFQALKHPVHLSYSLEDVAEGLSIPLQEGTREDYLRRMFQAPESVRNFKDAPMVFVDSAGKAIAWYLPNIFTSRRCWQSAVFDAAKTVGKLPKSVIRMCPSDSGYSSDYKRPADSQGPSGTWRTETGTFANPDHGQIPPGLVNLAAAWYEQGHGFPAHPHP